MRFHNNRNPHHGSRLLNNLSVTLVMVFRISSLSLGVGSPTNSTLSSRPGLSMAGSMMSAISITNKHSNGIHMETSLVFNIGTPYLE